LDGFGANESILGTFFPLTFGAKAHLKKKVKLQLIFNHKKNVLIGKRSNTKYEKIVFRISKLVFFIYFAFLHIKNDALRIITFEHF